MTLNLSEMNWLLAATDCDQYSSPSELSGELIWVETKIPSTVAESIQNCEHYGHLLEHIESKDWWFQCSFDVDDLTNEATPKLILSGLATLAEVWLNDEKILDANNMFVEHSIALENIKPTNNQLLICFRSLEKKFSTRYPRPGWKTKLVNNQNLRWARTSLLGRIPGWTPPVVAVGPWLPMRLETGVYFEKLVLKTKYEGEMGLVDFSCDLLNAASVSNAELIIGGDSFPLQANEKETGEIKLETKTNFSQPELWWPHTHGTSKTYPATLKVQTKQQTFEWPIGPIGFRNIRVNQEAEKFHIIVNGKTVFCRGACWTINDNITLSGDQELLEQQLLQFKQAGGNMVRIVGTMIYESENFYQLCSKHGIMVWQDFMFANMDYPFTDTEFRDSVDKEVEQQIKRLVKHPSLIMLCGNSEVQQQIAMLGFSAEHQNIEFYDEQLANQVEESNISYVPSSPFGGDLPFHVNQSLSHYYGVGAYQCSIPEVRSHDVKFTSECLGFANIPQEFVRNKVLNGDIPKIHNPVWKAATPRDSGTGWDFEDIRDFYLKQEYWVEPNKLRYEDPEKYLQLSELVTGKMMGQTFAEWRSVHSSCMGGLVWFFKDIQLGAGWGIFDSLGYPKACFYELKKHWQPIELVLTNESINGVDAHIINESEKVLTGQLIVKLINLQGRITTEAKQDIKIESFHSTRVNLESVLGGFNDIAYAYRFGPASHRAICVELQDELKVLAEAVLDIDKGVPQIDYQAELDYQLSAVDESTYELSVTADKYLIAVTIKTPGFIAEDNFFNLIPNTRKKIVLKRHCQHNGKFKGYLTALNLAEEIKLRPSRNEENQ